MKRILVLAVIAAILIISCKSQKPVANVTYTGGSEDLYRYQWSLVELNGKAVENSKAKLAFSPGQVNRVTGNTGCNNLNGSMELSGDHMLKFSPAAVTRMACPGENVEAPFLQMLQQATHWSINGKVLSLYGGSIVLGKFNAVDVSGAVPADLAGTWELEYITGPRIAFEGLYPEKKPTIIIDASSDYKGNTSCNGMGGKFTVKENTIKFSAPITTMMACPGNGEQTFLKTLDMIDAWAIEGGKLLLKGKGVDMMRFVKK